MVVYKYVFVDTKGELGHPNAEVVRLDAQLALLNKYNDLLERKFNELKATESTFWMKYWVLATYNRRCVFRSARTLRAVINSLNEMHNKLKEEDKQVMFHPVFMVYRFSSRKIHSYWTHVRIPLFPRLGRSKWRGKHEQKPWLCTGAPSCSVLNTMQET